MYLYSGGGFQCKSAHEKCPVLVGEFSVLNIYATYRTCHSLYVDQCSKRVDADMYLILNLCL